MSIKDQHWNMPAAYLKLMLQYAAAKELPAERLLASTGLLADSLLQSDRPVSLGQTRRVLRNAARLMGPDWHLSLSPRLTIPSHGPLGFAVVTAPDLRASVDTLLRFIGIRGPFLWLAGAVEDEWFVIRLYEATDMGEQRNALIELALLSIQSLLERPLGRELTGARIALAYPEPPYRQKLAARFHTRLEFDADGHSLSFPAGWLDEPCVMHDEAMYRYLLMRCEEDLCSASGILPTEIAVRQAILANTERLPSLQEVAASQHVSVRTLIRRLKRGNTSYRSILEGVRRRLARDYLLHSDMRVASISYRLGYHDPSNFGRAFRSWFGVSPGRFRSRMRQSG